MKLSTFCSLVKKDYLHKMPAQSIHTQQCYLCGCVNMVRDKQSRKHPAQMRQYNELSTLCKEFIVAVIFPQQTVLIYLNYLNSGRPSHTLEDCHLFRLNLLNDMIDWAEENENCQ